MKHPYGLGIGLGCAIGAALSVVLKNIVIGGGVAIVLAVAIVLYENRHLRLRSQKD